MNSCIFHGLDWFLGIPRHFPLSLSRVDYMHRCQILKLKNSLLPRLLQPTRMSIRSLLHFSIVLITGIGSVNVWWSSVRDNVSAATQQKITILNEHGEKLVGVFHDTGSAKIVVLCHGLRSSKEDNTMVNLAAVLEKEGISAFRFDFSGNGESEGSFQYGNYLTEAEDLRAVIQYFTGINRSTVVVLGHSKGGNVVLLYASKYHDIPAVVNLSGRYNLKRGIEESLGKKFLERIKKDGYIDVKTRTGEIDFRVTKESMMERLNINMHEACLSIDERCRVLTVHGSADEVIPVEDAMEFAKIIPNHRLQIIEGADHGYSSHQDELASAVLPFIKECVQHVAK